MGFNSYEELKAAVEERRKDILTLEIDLGGEYSPEHEAAKAALQRAEVMKGVIGQPFLGGDDDNAELKRKVEETRPEQKLVFVQYRRLDLQEWTAITKTTGLSAMDQYERVLPKTFIGIYGSDPVRPDDLPMDQYWEAPQPLSTDAELLSSRSPNTILPGGALNPVVQAFMSWQNSGGEVSIRPTRSGLV